MEKVRLAERFSAISEYWAPVVVARLNEQEVKLVRVRGEFQWHRHTREDELFLVVNGSLRMDLRDRSIRLSRGELLVVPKGTEHRPVAEPEAEVLLFEPATTVRTGDPEEDF